MQADPAAPDRLRRWARIGTTVVVLAIVWGYLLSYFKPSLLLLDTMDAGGDTPSFHRPIQHLKDVLLPAGNPLGWDLGNFAGYAPYQFYFLPPAMLIVTLTWLGVPFFIAFKLVTVLGTFLLPVSSALCMRAMGYRFPVPLIAAAASLMFLFNEGNSMWGGNIPSTLAGEFAHSLAFALSILFIGALYRGVEELRGRRRLGVLLAVIGLCHPVAFINSTAPGVYFLLGREKFARNARFIAAVYGTAVLLMSFWLVPLIAKLGYATSINWKWYFQSWREVLPKMFYPVLALAVIDLLWVAVRRRPEDRPARYLFVSLVVTALCFFNATEVGLPEIRFVPLAYMLLILLAVDLAARVVPLRLAPHVGALALIAGMLWWVHSNTSFIPSWIRWNYEGLQSKPTWGLLERMTTKLRGTMNDPRIAYENSPLHDRFGSMRVFESLPLLTGRPTLEGVLLQTAVNSPFIYWLQSQVSKQGSGVIPGYPYPSFDAPRATPRLALYNASDWITITPEIEKPLLKDPRWERTFHEPPYSIFHLKELDPHYVRVPKFRPVLMDTDDWKHDFHRWFANDAALDVPLVLGKSVPAALRSQFPLTTTSPTVLPREPITKRCEIEERLDHLQIEFTTTCPGEPHWIAVSYFPNWRVEGAQHVFLASPAFMMVIPDGPHVTLRFQRIGADYLGLVLSALGVLACVAVRPLRTLAPALDARLERVLTAAHPWLLWGGIVVVVCVTMLSVARDWGPQYFYNRGWKAFSSNDYVASQRDFEWAILLGGKTNTAADATFFRAASLLRQNRFAEAMEGYKDVVRRFENSIWVAESEYHVGLCLRHLGRIDEALQKFQYVIDTYPGNRWAGFAAEQQAQIRAERARSAPPGAQPD
ncbi:MAG TPA: 6-pyruvoyl-tetrahydropterin synthase-related protein [Candidatus Limnocylindria bacterium]|nr:6-pyruvoyl-tetrahydropterin synthase-related protein [Candidatus Limnocylindria bacterium]